MDTRPLSGKVGLVTGASRGIGRGIALELAARGADVAVNYRKSREEADSLVGIIQGLGLRAIAVQADVTKLTEITALLEQVKQNLGRVDIVVSNSGLEDFTPVLNVTEEIYDQVFNTNTKAQFFVAQQAYKHIEPCGSIILTSSIAAATRLPKHHSLYAASKNAIKAFVRTLSTDFGDKKIRVNAITPGGVLSDMFADVAWRYAPGATSESSKYCQLCYLCQD